MSKHWLVTGGSGFVGQAFIRSRLALGDRVSSLTRKDLSRQSTLHPNVTWVNGWDQLGDDITHVLNLAGEGIADKRWTDRRKQALLDSRVALTESLVEWMRGQSIERFISASAVGFYGPSAQTLDESASAGKGFAADLCSQWEAAALCATAPTAIVRLGVVLGPGGFMDRMRPLFKVGLGGPIGDGAHALPWIHRDDVVRLFNHIADQQLQGIFNAVAPDAITQGQFAKAMGRAVKRPAFLPTPGFALRLGFGQMAEELLLSGQFVHPKATLASGFEFQHPTIASGVQAALDQY